MSLSSCFAAAHLAVALLQTHASAAPSTSVAATAALATPVTAGSATPLAIGGAAPDFEYRSSDFGWRKLSDVLDQGNVLLVFSDDDATLRTIELSRGQLSEAGVVPMVITRMDVDATWRAVSRCEVRYSVLSDPAGDVRSRFAALSANSGWVLVDEHGRVRGFGSDAGRTEDWAALAADALEGNSAEAVDAP
ncbi:MAG: redoxin domain-containing protein [Candidatus Eisenbacteria bacterium]